MDNKNIIFKIINIILYIVAFILIIIISLNTVNTIFCIKKIENSYTGFFNYDIMPFTHYSIVFIISIFISIYSIIYFIITRKSLPTLILSLFTFFYTILYFGIELILVGNAVGLIQ